MICQLALMIGLSLARCGGFAAVDGDTFIVRETEEHVRLNNADTPEIHPARCEYEARIGYAAKRELQRLLDSGPVTISRSKIDRYGRTVAAVAIDGQDVGDTLIAMGLARPYHGEKRRPWCPANPQEVQ